MGVSPGLRALRFFGGFIWGRIGSFTAAVANPLGRPPNSSSPGNTQTHELKNASVNKTKTPAEIDRGSRIH